MGFREGSTTLTLNIIYVVCFSKLKLSESQFGELEQYERNLKVEVDIIPRRLEKLLCAFSWRVMGGSIQNVVLVDMNVLRVDLRVS